MKKLLTVLMSVVIAMLTLSMLVFSACSPEKDPNKIYVGMECGYAPFNYTQTDDSNGAVKISNAPGYANGYDVMIAQKIAEEVGKELVIVKYDWEALVNAVVTGALDFIIAGMSPTEERLQSIDFSNAYYESHLVIVVRKDGKYANATSLSDFNGANIVAQLGTFHDKALEAQGGQYGITRATPIDTFPMMINALNAKTVDGYVAEEPGAVSDCSLNPDLTYVHLVNNTTGFTTTPEDTQIAVGLKKGSEYKEKINAALAKLSAEERLALMERATELATN
ncbi:MAG: transporter substrate-binding domain-containing protein [Clostridia bacterium]|nr:transporter substrate-binding domain-containing protein [Clostridia bacterium]